MTLTQVGVNFLNAADVVMMARCYVCWKTASRPGCLSLPAAASPSTRMKELRAAAKMIRPTVLIVEDEPMIRELLTLYLEDWGAMVTPVATADDGKEALGKQDWTLLLTDVQTPGLLNGVDLAWMASQEKPQTRIIVMSGYYEFAGRVLPPGAQFLPKPWPITRLQELLCAQLKHADGPGTPVSAKLDSSQTFANKA